MSDRSLSRAWVRKSHDRSRCWRASIQSPYPEPDTTDSVRDLRARAALLGASSHVLHASAFETAESSSEYSDDV